MNLKKPKFWDYKKISILAVILIPLSIIYQLIFLIIKILKPKEKFNIPIICVGNIYLGGTGKTPLAIEIFNILKSLNRNPAFITKPHNYLKDEIEMLKATGKTFTAKNRKTSINLSIENDHDVVILDDGFQDFTISPNFSIICFNSKQLMGNGFVIPSGPLRESFSSIKKADCIFVNGEKNLDFEKKIYELKTDAKIFYSKYIIKNLNRYKNKKVIAFAGIGNPQNFFDLLKDNHIDIKETISFPDHHNFSENDYNSITINNQNLLLLTTEKDYYRLNEKMKKKVEYIEVDLKIENKIEFTKLIENKL